MKVGTDGVLLGAWVALGAADRLLLDVRTIFPEDMEYIADTAAEVLA